MPFPKGLEGKADFLEVVSFLSLDLMSNLYL
jgi:hypothetical protein